MIRVSSKGNYKKTFKFLKYLEKNDFYDILNKYGQRGVDILSANTPRDTGTTANSWSYEIEKIGDTVKIYWNNNNKTESGIPIVVLIRYGHGTRGGTYVSGYDFVTPVADEIFEKMINEMWEEVKGKNV